MHNPCFQLPKKLKDRQELINNISQVTKSILQTAVALNVTKNIIKKKIKRLAANGGNELLKVGEPEKISKNN